MHTSVGRVLTFLTVIVGVGLLRFTEADAAPPNQQRGDQSFKPRAGYFRTVELFRLRRRLATRAAAAPSPQEVLEGVRRIPTILVDFDNRHGKFPAGDYHDLLFETYDDDFLTRDIRRTVTQYYLDMSGGKLTVVGTVVGWYRAPKDDTYYENDKEGDGPPFGELLTFALEKADDDLDFGEFDNDGPDGQPNSGDDDGIVDTVFFIHPESGAECGGESEKNIWSHSWHYSDEGYDHNGPFKTDDPRRDGDGNPILGDDGEPVVVLVEDYTIQPGLRCREIGETSDKIVEIGVFAHEYGHALGLPDLYDRTDHPKKSRGIGRWGLMAGGSDGAAYGQADHPVRLSAWSLARLGWADLRVVNPPQSLEVEPVQERGRVYVVDVEATDGNEYFLIEYRDTAWSDAAGKMVNWDRKLMTSGLAVWHIDDSVGAQSEDWPFAPKNQGQNDNPSIPGEDAHALVALEQADCQRDLEYNRDSGDEFDLWRTNAPFSDEQPCGAVPYDGSDPVFELSNFDFASGTVSLDEPEQDAIVANEPAPSRGSVAEVEPNAAGARASNSPTARRGAPAAEASSRASALVVDRPMFAMGSTRAVILTQEQERSVESLKKAAENRAVASEDFVYIDSLPDTERAVVADLPEHAVRKELPRSAQFPVLMWQAKQRVREITPESDVSDGVDGELKTLQREGKAGDSIQRQVDPSGKRVERVTGLRIPSEAANPKDDSRKKLDTNFKEWIGEDVAVREIPGRSKPDDRAQRYEQVFSVNGVQMPIFKQEVAVFYDSDGNVKALTAKTVDPENLEVGGTPGDLSAVEAKTIATKALGLPEKRKDDLVDGGEGVYLVDANPEDAHIARRVQIPIGDAKSISVFVDSETKKVVGIE